MERSKHLVLFPFMAQGHLIPYLALARLLERRSGVSRVSLVSTPLNIAKLAASLPADSSVNLVELPFCSTDHGLPPRTENTDCLTSQFQLPFYLATQSSTLKSSFEELVSGICKRYDDLAVCIISDFLLGWTVEVAEKLSIFHVVFIPGGAYPFGMFFSLWLNLPHCNADKGEEDQFTLPDFPEALTYRYSRLPKYLTLCDETNPWTRFSQSQLNMCLRSDGILFNTVKELEGIGLVYFSRKTNRPVWTIGPIVTSKLDSQASCSQPCVQWLNLHQPSSVLYVCFGSQFSISAQQMRGLAKGLEASGKPFIWVVRPPLECDYSPATEDFNLDDYLPEGFELRIRERQQGILVRKWAPQVDILAHESTGAFLSHCGWNSVMESLTHGVPIIGWPLSAEQYYTSKMLVEDFQVSVEIANGESMEIDSDHVGAVIDMVLEGTNMGGQMRRKALIIRDAMAAAIKEGEEFEGSSVRSLNDFLRASFSTGKTDRATLSPLI
ncbi:UDP-glycosyltransferase 92A1-like [Aristolochia californica]|uniref:UDP-glycosyltransferase 92A1-like n=1 Tax=Aristolochia californica TaxID=171875 RepID=UPI0035E0BFEE